MEEEKASYHKCNRPPEPISYVGSELQVLLWIFLLPILGYVTLDSSLTSSAVRRLKKVGGIIAQR